MISYQSIPMEDLTFQQENDLMLKHLGKVINIPYHQYPNRMVLFTNEFLKIRNISIFCKQNAKTQAGQRTTYDFEFKL